MGLVEAIRDWRLFYLGPKSSTNDFGAGSYGEADSVHYGGSASLGNVVDPETFKPFGLDGVRVADLSAFKEPTPVHQRTRGSAKVEFSSVLWSGSVRDCGLCTKERAARQRWNSRLCCGVDL